MQSASSKGGHAEFGRAFPCAQAQVHYADVTDSRVYRTLQQSNNSGNGPQDVSLTTQQLSSKANGRGVNTAEKAGGYGLQGGRGNQNQNCTEREATDEWTHSLGVCCQDQYDIDVVNPRLSKVITAASLRRAFWLVRPLPPARALRSASGAAGSRLFEPIFFGVAENVRLPNLASHAPEDFPVLSDNPRRGS
jgi:hypothetical protein